jgi:hypothetical protein
MLNSEVWLHQQLREQLWKGLAAVSAYLSIPYIFGTAPGDYRSTPPNFPPQPQFTHWSRVTPFALEPRESISSRPPKYPLKETPSAADFWQAHQALLKALDKAARFV